MESDIQNADAHLFVEFYESRAKDYEGFVFVRIMTPGDKTNIFDQPAKDEHKLRFPRQWLHFQMQQQGIDGGVVGTDLSLWSADEPEILGENQMMELQILKFQTVEQVAMASDAQLQKIGMGGPGLRERARAYLARRNASVANSELAEAKAQLATLQAQMTQMMDMMTAAPATSKRGKGSGDGLLDADAGNAGNG